MGFQAVVVLVRAPLVRALFHAVGLALGGDDDGGVVEESVEKADRGGVHG